MRDDGTELSPELIERMQKVGGQEFGRLAFEQFFGPPKVDAVALTLMQKTASVADTALFKAAEQVRPEAPLELYEELGGGFKLAGVADRAKGFARVGELLSGSRAKELGAAKEIADRTAAGTFGAALKYDHTKVTPSMLAAVHKGTAHLHPAKGGLSPEKKDILRLAGQAHDHHKAVTRSSRLGKVLSAEEAKVRGARVGAAGAGAAAIAGGVAAARHKDSDK